MDHLEEHQKHSLPQQEHRASQYHHHHQQQQPQLAGRGQQGGGRQHHHHHHHHQHIAQQQQQQSSYYHQQQQSSYATQQYASARRTFAGQQEQADIEYQQQSQQHPQARMNYPMHQTQPYPPAAATAAAAAYPPPQQQQHTYATQAPSNYHHQQQLAMHHSIQMQQIMLEQQQSHSHQTAQPQHHLNAPPLQHAQHQPYVQPTVGRLPSDRPLIKLSVSLIDTYKHINKVYYEERDARRAARAAQKQQQAAAAAAAAAATSSSQKGPGANNNGWDDENYDYIVTAGEMFYGRYIIKERIGKGSFGQVVRAEDSQTKKDVAIKIIKSKKPFLMQAKTEIELLTHLCEKDAGDQHNIVRLLSHFMYRNHQCLVFEMLSLNLYELLKNTQFGGVSLNLIRKFAKQILKSLSFLSRPDVDIIHCDLKPENILLRHHKRSGVKVIDFGSSCRSDKRMYSYIQSRFYRSPEVMLGLPYSVAIDMWSLGCILAEMHTGEPLFSGSDQFDQMQKIIKLLGMVPSRMLDKAAEQQRSQFFERARAPSGREEWVVKRVNPASTSSSSRSTSQSKRFVPGVDPIKALKDVICADNSKKKRLPAGETGNSPSNYELFVDLIYRMLAYDPSDRIKPDDALMHPFIRTEGTPSASSSPFPGSVGGGSAEGGESSTGGRKKEVVKRAPPP